MRLALNIGWQDDLSTQREAVLAKAQAADRAGVHSVWVEEAWGRDAFSLLVQIADRTEQIQLATGIVNTFSRTPAALAQHFASLDEISGGRAIIGLGSSGPAVIEGLHGVPFNKPLARTKDYVQILRTLLAGEQLKYEGGAVAASGGFTLAFRPPRADVPVYLASLLPRSLKQLAEIADGWLPIWTPIEAVPKLVESVQSGVPASRSGLEVRSPGQVIISERAEEIRNATRASLAFYIARMGDFYAQHLQRIGYEELVQSVRGAWKSDGRGAAVAAISEEAQQSFTFVTPDVGEARDRLAQQAAAGITVHQVDVDSDDPAEVGKRLAELAG